MTFKAGAKLPVHHVNCLDCGAPVERKTYWRKPRCTECGRRKTKIYEAAKLRRLRQQARRYRILLHVMGYEDEQFPQMLRDLKESEFCFRRRPETREARLDRTLERRARAYA